ncbi:hypothetical protein [Deinococcus sp.]|uniref:hypothetical protein n=1 Tax=Deinococcus sp. TaxID=47478 RepID=UPI0025B815B5|nr:hypothetical protein [Deinococcus sp.]
MNISTQIMLVQATPPGGIILHVRNQPGSLYGATIMGIDGPNVVLEFSPSGTGNWITFPLPVALNSELYLRLTRRDNSDTVSTIRLTAPAPLSSTLDGDGYLSIEGGPLVATKPQHAALSGRVTTLEAGGGGSGGGGGGAGGGGGSGGPIVLSQGAGADNLDRISGAGTNIPVRRLSIRADTIPLQVIDQILINAVQAPPGSLQTIGLYDLNGTPIYEGSPLGMTTNFLGTTVQIPPLLYGNPYDTLVLLFNTDVSIPSYAVSQVGASINVRAKDQYNNSLNGMVGVQLQAAAAGALNGPVTHYSLPIVRTPTVDPPRGGYWEFVDPASGPQKIRYSNGQNWFSTTLTQE